MLLSCRHYTNTYDTYNGGCLKCTEKVLTDLAAIIVSFLHIPVSEVCFVVVSRLERDISKMHLVALLQVDRTGAQRASSHTPEPDVVPATRHHPTAQDSSLQ